MTEKEKILKEVKTRLLCRAIKVSTVKGVKPGGKPHVLIPEKVFYLDIEKCFDQATPLNVEKMINDDHAVDTYTDGIVKPVGGDPKHKVQIFSNDKADIWIAVDLLKLFDLSIAHFKASDKKSPLYIYEDETLVGLVLPVNHA